MACTADVVPRPIILLLLCQLQFLKLNMLLAWFGIVAPHCLLLSVIHALRAIGPFCVLVKNYRLEVHEHVERQLLVEVIGNLLSFIWK
jgi:hypothetical protein